jgi:hypothetical protein
MRFPRVRFTVRRMMDAVAVMAFAAWLIVPAVRILNDPGWHWLTHLWQRPDGSHLYSGHEVAFWGRYRRGLLGLPWDCRFNLCKENARACREIDSGRSVASMTRDHPIVLLPSSSPW